MGQKIEGGSSPKETTLIKAFTAALKHRQPLYPGDYPALAVSIEPPSLGNGPGQPPPPPPQSPPQSLPQSPPQSLPQSYAQQMMRQQVGYGAPQSPAAEAAGYTPSFYGVMPLEPQAPPAYSPRAPNAPNAPNAPPANEAGEVDPEDDMDISDECSICMERQIDCVLVPCGHMCACFTCAGPMEECPICRTSVDKAVKTFRAGGGGGAPY